MIEANAAEPIEFDHWDHPVVRALDAWISINGAAFEAIIRTGMALTQQSAAFAQTLVQLAPASDVQENNKSDQDREHAPASEPGCCEGCASPETCSRLTASFDLELRH